MKLRFLGGVNEVGRLGMILEHEGTRLLFDYGIAPKDPPLYPEPCPPVDAALLSHAHLDHSGMMPWVAGRHAIPVVANPVTQPIAELLAYDSMKICRLEGWPSPYARDDVSALSGAWEDAILGETRRLGAVDVRYHSAGHIPGSTMFEVRDGSTNLLFTGDMNLVDTHLVRAADPVKCDVLVTEATYSGRQHPDRAEEEERFLDAVRDVVEDGGQVIVPAFAVGRTQEVLMMLHGEGHEVWVDGMGKRVSRMMLDNPKSLASPRDLSRAVEDAHFVKSHSQRERASRDANVIVTTSGMMEGGPVVYYLKQVRDDPASAVFMTGYQVAGSGGRTLLDTGVFVNEDERYPVAGKVDRFNFSSHAGHDELVEFARACGPEKVVLFHSDNREPLAKDLSEFAEVILLDTGEETVVD